MNYFLFMCLLVSAKSSFFGNEDFDNEYIRQLGSPEEYTGCFKSEDTICARRFPENCTIERVRHQCPRMCGECAPFSPKCPKEYPFGCCWNGERANDIEKSNCPQCRDRMRSACRQPHFKADCDFSKNTAQTRRLCPETCDACNDYAAAVPAAPCEDADARCAKMEDTSCCEKSEILQDLCRKTCGICF